MNMHIGALQQQHQNWKAVRERLFKTPTKERTSSDRLNIVKPAPISTYFRPPREEVDHNAHVKAYERRLMEEAVNPVAVYMKDRCEELGVSYQEIIGQSRCRRIYEPRHWMIWEVAKRFGCSYPQLGRYFGSRDHTSCLHAFNKISALIAEGRLQVSENGKISAASQ